MSTVILGRTGLAVAQDGFGALPVHRRSVEDAVPLLRRALDSGITFFDTARGYSDSEEKLGLALSGRRGEFILATKTGAGGAAGFWSDLETSLDKLQTAYLDVYQFHNPGLCPKPGDGSGLYEAMLEAREQGKIRFIGITCHKAGTAREAVESGLYDTLQFPLSYLSGERELELVRLCAERGVGFIAMKALAGGLITDIAAARAWMRQFDHVVPIWGLQTEDELDALLAAARRPAVLDGETLAVIGRDRAELRGSFCRGCGYCMPCPAGIQISWCGRMSLLLRRAPAQGFLSGHWRGEMEKIKGCTSCGVCASRCPYQLDPAALLRENLRDYQTFL